MQSKNMAGDRDRRDFARSRRLRKIRAVSRRVRRKLRWRRSSKRTFLSTNEWVGTLEGLVNAQIRPQVTGYLVRQTYQEGSFVKKGQLLFEIDPRTFQAALDQAKGQLANAEQQLAQAEANQVKAQLDVNRYIPLAKEQAVTQQALDNAVQTNLAAQAAVRAAKAQIDAAKAQVAAAQLNLGFTKIVSLIDGIAGIAQAQIGDLVGPTSLLTTVSTLDPIKVYFPVSERGYLNYVKENPDAAKRAAQERQLRLELLLADGWLYPHKGNFSLADREVDVKTGTLRLAGTVPESGKYPSSRPVRPRSGDHNDEERRSAGSPARGDRAAR